MHLMRLQSPGISKKVTTRPDKVSNTTRGFTALFTKNIKLTTHGAVPWGHPRSVVWSIGQWWRLPRQITTREITLQLNFTLQLELLHYNLDKFTLQLEFVEKC